MANPIKNQAYSFNLQLVDSNDRSKFKVDPTIENGDVKISIDGGAPQNISSLPVGYPSGSSNIRVSLTAAEMNGTTVLVIFSDQAGSQWDDVTVAIETDVSESVPMGGATGGAVDMTYAQVIAQVTGRLNRNDLDDPTSSPPITKARDAIRAVILHYQRELFYPAEFTDSSKTCTIGSRWVDYPSGWQDVRLIRILQSGTNWIPLVRKSYEYILSQDVLNTPVQSLPSVWAPYNDPATGLRAVRLFPVPNLAYPLEFTMTLPPDPPVLDTDINFWTSDARELVIEGAIEHICNRWINNPVRGQQAKEAKESEELSLSSKTIRAMGEFIIRPYY